MGNPYPQMANSASRMPVGSGQPVQIISDTKFSTKTFAIGVAASFTDYFTTTPIQDATVDWYDAANQLVTSAKQFVIQSIGVKVFSTSIADINAFINSGILILTCQQKEIGRYRIRVLNSGGDVFVAGAQVAAASSVGVSNGQPQAEPWRIAELAIQTNQTFKATVAMPVLAPYTVIASTNVEVDLFGYEARPAA
jgi:hypothetical protein